MKMGNRSWMGAAWLLLGGAAMSLYAPTARAEEDWKGQSDNAIGSFGGMLGLGIVNWNPGFVVLGTAAAKIIQRGFVPDINDSVWVEGQGGPLFTQGNTIFAYSAHLRWDFVKDDQWTFYALGGLGGNVSGVDGGHFELFPRFALGAFWKMGDVFDWRAEISHEWITIGATFPF